jgi:hypothetical protein
MAALAAAAEAKAAKQAAEEAAAKAAAEAGGDGPPEYEGADEVEEQEAELEAPVTLGTFRNILDMLKDQR